MLPAAPLPLCPGLSWGRKGHGLRKSWEGLVGVAWPWVLVQLLDQPQVGLWLGLAESSAGAGGLCLSRAGAEPFQSLQATPCPGCGDRGCETGETGQGILERFILENKEESVITSNYTTVFLALRSLLAT